MVTTPEAQVKCTFNALESLFPMERLREMIQLRQDERDAKRKAHNPVFPLPPEEDPKEFDKAFWQNPNITNYEKVAIAVIRFRVNKWMGELSRFSPEQHAKILEDKTSYVCALVVTAWLEVLRHARRKNKGQPVRLDGQLLPPPELTNYIGVGLYEFMARVSHVLSAEQVLELMTLYAANLAPILDAMFANNPNGFNLTEHLFICRDKGGIYLTPKDKINI